MDDAVGTVVDTTSAIASRKTHGSRRASRGGITFDFVQLARAATTDGLLSSLRSRTSEFATEYFRMVVQRIPVVYIWRRATDVSHVFGCGTNLTNCTRVLRQSKRQPKQRKTSSVAYGTYGVNRGGN
jgi:hypothetical protein